MSIAFFSVADVRGIAEPAKALSANGWQIQAEGEALKALEKARVAVAKATLAQGSKADLLFLNLPLKGLDEKAAAQTAPRAALIRKSACAAKKRPVVACADLYAEAAACAKNGPDAETVRRWSVLAVRHLAAYDAALDVALSREVLGEEVLHLEYTDGAVLRYGENGHQKAVFYKEKGWTESSLANARQLHGKELSYNNIVDADAALEMMREFSGQPAVAIIKHLNPAGLATGTTLEEAFEAAWSGDPVSAFGSVIACSQKVDLATALRLKGRFVEILLAPGFDADALEFLRGKSKDIRLLEIDNVEAARPCPVYKHVIVGMLAQDRDVETIKEWRCVTKTPFPKEKEALARFTWVVTKYTKSNAIVMGMEYKPGCFKVLGLGPGQPNRIDSNLRLCQPRVRDNVARMELPEGTTLAEYTHQVFSGLVMGSDAFFPFSDNVDAAADAGVKLIVQPGGAKRDEEVIARCDELGVAMIFTGMRHFRH